MCSLVAKFNDGMVARGSLGMDGCLCTPHHVPADCFSNGRSESRQATVIIEDPLSKSVLWSQPLSPRRYKEWDDMAVAGLENLPYHTVSDLASQVLYMYFVPLCDLEWSVCS